MPLYHRIRRYGVLVATLAAWPALAAANTLLVPQDYPTIQGAIDAAGAGDEVLVAPGTYNETLRITKSSIAVRAATTGAAVIDATGKLGDPVGPFPVVAIGFAPGSPDFIDDVTFCGFKITGANPEQFVVRIGLNQTRNSRICCNTLEVPTGTNARVQFGISTLGDRFLSVDHNAITGPGDASPGVGIVALRFPPANPVRSQEVDFHHNEITGCGRFGIVMAGADGGTIAHNTCNGNGIGIRALDVHGVTIVHNTTDENTKTDPAVQALSAGILLQSSQGGLVAYNHAEGNNRGIFFAADLPGLLVSDDNTFAHDLCFGNALGDLILAGGGSVIEEKNDVGSPGSAGSH